VRASRRALRALLSMETFARIANRDSLFVAG
jgi:hypothetical protein